MLYSALLLVSKKTLRIMFLTCFILFLLISESSLGYAQEADNPLQLNNTVYDGLDIVFLVDQSGSMENNDPFGQRANVIKWVIQYLGIDNLYSRKDAVHRVGIVSFGTGTAIDLPLSSLKTNNEEEWNDLYAELQAAAVTKDMTNTDVLLGLEEVFKVFKEAPPRPEGSSATRGIVILTDGAPYRENWQVDQRYQGSDFYTPYFRDIRTFINDNLAIAPSSRSTTGYHIWVLGLNNQADTGQLSAPGTSWLEQEVYWENVLNPFANVDRVRRIGSDQNAKIPDDVVRVLDTMMLGGVCNDNTEVTDKPSCIIEQDFVVPPYVARADFSVFKPNPGSTIAFFTPDQQLLDIGSAAVKVKGTGEVIETISVQNPTPGEWHWQKVDSSADTATVVFQSLFAQVNLLQPNKSSDLFDTVFLSIELQDLESHRLQELSQYPIVANAKVIAPNGDETTFKMITQNDGVWRAEQSMILDQPGDYSVTFTGATEDIKGQEINLFSNWREVFSVGNLKPSLISPAGDVAIFHRIPMEFALSKADGTQPDMSPQQSVIMQATLTGPDGGVTPLEIVSGSASNSYSTKQPVTPHVPGQYSIRVKGTMNFAGKTIDLFEQSLEFRVMAIKTTIASPVGDQPRNGLSKILLQLDDDTNSPYIEDTSLPWEIAAVVKRPDGSTLSTLPLSKIADGRYEANFTPDIDGNWEISISGRITLPDGSRVTTINDLSKSFMVYPTTLMNINVISPAVGERQKIRSIPRVLPLPETIIGKVLPSDITIEIVDEMGNLLSLQDISPVPINAVSLRLQESGRPSVSFPVTMTLSSENPMQLVASVSGLSHVGEYKLLVSPGILNREYLPEGNWPQEITFERYDPWSTVTYVLLAMEIILLAIILFLMARAIIVRINPARGTLEFEKVGGTGKSSYGTLALSGYGKNTFVIKGSKLRALLASEAADSLSKLKIKNATERTKSTDEFGMSSGLDGSAIRIWVWSGDNDPIISDEILANNQSTMLHGDIQIRYHRD